ncbi:hypothetical protein DOM21_00965 [Bacteriovorax stolpii]|nr:hypothetical protein DOM21_00965 [Bacteriovorax stolpii]
MISFFLHFLISSVMAVSLESNCQKIVISEKEIKFAETKECKEKDLRQKSNLSRDVQNVFFVEGQKKNEFYIFYQKIEDTMFCKFPTDYIKVVGGTRKWSGLDQLGQVIGLINQQRVLRLNVSESTNTHKLCYPFPGFTRARKIRKSLLPEKMAAKNDLYMIFSKRMGSLFFINPNLNRFEFVMNTTREVTIMDAIIRKNGDLVMLTKNRTDAKFCMEQWDFESGVKMKEVCDLEATEGQVLIDFDSKLLRAYKKNEEIVFEERSFLGVPKMIKALKVGRGFNLSTAIETFD